MIKLTDLLEGITKTFDPEKAAEILNKQYSSFGVHAFPWTESSIRIRLPNTSKRIDTEKGSRDISGSFPFDLTQLQKTIELLGYYVTSFTWDDLGGPEHIRYTSASDLIKKVKDRNITYQLTLDVQPLHRVGQEVSLPKYLYHVTDEKYIEKIRKVGLKPSSTSKMENYPDRVYCFTLDPHEISGNIGRMLGHGKSMLLTLDTTKLNTNIKFYKDPSSHNAVYTQGNIPPSAIVKIEPYQVANPT